ncbi:hypothetical protein THAOC_31600, partial [Thalassiosira oceanica]
MLRPHEHWSLLASASLRFPSRPENPGRKVFLTAEWTDYISPLQVVATPCHSHSKAGRTSLPPEAEGELGAAPRAYIAGEDERGHGWKSKYPDDDELTEEQRGRRCPLCRGIIPPSREQISSIKMTQLVMKYIKDKSDPRYKEHARKVKEFEAEYGEDWEDTAIEYGDADDCVRLPLYVVEATRGGNVRIALQWLVRGNIKDRVNAKCESYGNVGLLFLAADAKEHDLMVFLLLNGADVNITNSTGSSVLLSNCNISRVHPMAVKILLSWGAEVFLEGRRASSQDMKEIVDENMMEGNTAVANLLSSELGGRRCKIVSAPDNRDGLAGKTCVVGRHIKKSSQYEVTVEFTNESLLLGADNLERCDRTPQDPGYFVECKNNRLIRRDFESNEECRAFIASIGADREGFAEVDPDAEAKAEQAAADLLAELGLDDLEDPSSNAPKKGARSAPPAGKKKKRRGKKKGRNPGCTYLAPPLVPAAGLSSQQRPRLGGTLGSYFLGQGPHRKGDRDGRGCCRDGPVCRGSRRSRIHPRFPGSAASHGRRSGQTTSSTATQSRPSFSGVGLFDPPPLPRRRGAQSSDHGPEPSLGGQYVSSAGGNHNFWTNSSSSSLERLYAAAEAMKRGTDRPSDVSNEDRRRPLSRPLPRPADSFSARGAETLLISFALQRGGEGAATTFAPPPPPASAGGGSLVARRVRPPHSGPRAIGARFRGPKDGAAARHRGSRRGRRRRVGVPAVRAASPQPPPGDWRRLSPSEAPARDGRSRTPPAVGPPSRTRPTPRRALRALRGQAERPAEAERDARPQSVPPPASEDATAVDTRDSTDDPSRQGRGRRHTAGGE